MAKLDPFRSPQARDDFIAKYDAVVADWPVDCEERDLKTEFGTTHVIVNGPESAPPLVLLHGAGATAAMWRPVIEALSATYRCYCVDTIIEGNKSIASRRSLGKRKLVAWLRQVFGALDIEQARVVGLSYGGVARRQSRSAGARTRESPRVALPCCDVRANYARVLPGGVLGQPAALTRTGSTLHPMDCRALRMWKPIRQQI